MRWRLPPPSPPPSFLCINGTLHSNVASLYFTFPLYFWSRATISFLFFFFFHLETWGLEITELETNKKETFGFWNWFLFDRSASECNAWLLPAGWLSLISSEWLTLLNTTCLMETLKYKKKRKRKKKSIIQNGTAAVLIARPLCLFFSARFYTSSAHVLSLAWCRGLQGHALQWSFTGGPSKFFQSGLPWINVCRRRSLSSTLQGRQRISNFVSRKGSHWTNWPDCALHFFFSLSVFLEYFFSPSNFVSSLIPEGTCHLLSTLMWNGTTPGG